MSDCIKLDPFVKLRRLSNTVIENFVKISNSSVKGDPKEEDEDPIMYIKTENKKQKRSRYTKPETGRLSRRAKQKVKTYNLENDPENESSVHETDVSEEETNNSDYEDRPKFKPKEEDEDLIMYIKTENKKQKWSRYTKTDEETGRLSRRAKQKVKTYSLENDSEDESSVHETDVSEEETNNSDYEDRPNIKPKEKDEEPIMYIETQNKKQKGSRYTKPDEETGRLSRRAKQKVKTYSLKNDSEDESSVHETDVSDEETNDSDYEDKPNIKETSDSNSTDRDSMPSKDSDSEYEPIYVRGRKRKATSKSRKTKGKQQKTAKGKELTEYEKLVQKNKNDKMAFLESLKINEVKEGFSDAVKSFSLAVKPKKIYNKKPPIVPRNQIARSSKVRIDLSEEAFDARAKSEAEKALFEMEKQKEEVVVHLPKRIHLEHVLDEDQSYELFLDDFRGLDQGCTEPIENYESGFNDMHLLTSHVKQFKLTKMDALDIHPMREKIIFAGGAGNGNIYLWNMTDLEPYAFELHDKGFSHLQFYPDSPHLIMCCSKDGLLRKGDLVSHVYSKVTDYKDCTYFDFVNPDTFLLAHRDGYVTVVDMRTSRKKKNLQCDDSVIRSVSVNPSNKTEFITPTSKGCVRLWDMRQLKKRPIVEVPHLDAKKIVYSAIYSPLTGKAVLVASKKGQICISDTASWTRSFSTMVGFRIGLGFSYLINAAWQPRTDSIFAVGSKLYPRGFDIYNRRMKIFNYSHENIKTQITHCSFHPSLPIIAGIGSGTVFPFADKKLQIEQ